eukprot:s232_g25.t1
MVSLFVLCVSMLFKLSGWHPPMTARFAGGEPLAAAMAVHQNLLPVTQTLCWQQARPYNVQRGRIPTAHCRLKKTPKFNMYLFLNFLHIPL